MVAFRRRLVRAVLGSWCEAGDAMTAPMPQWGSSTARRMATPVAIEIREGVWFKVGAMCRCVARYTEGHMSNGRLQPVCCRWLLAQSICRWWCWRAMMHGKREQKLKSSRSPAKQSWSVNLVPCRERPSSIGFPSQSPSLCIPRSPQPLPSATVPKASKCIKD